jgi:hypothetical protein
MSKIKPLEYELIETVERTQVNDGWKTHTTALDQATALQLIPHAYSADSRIIVMHRDHTVKVPFHPNAQRQSFIAPPSRRPRGRGECMAYLLAHPTYNGDSSGFAQHVRWRALDSLFDTFSVLNDVRSHDENEQLRQATMEYVDACTEGGTVPEFDNREDQFIAEHRGWGIARSGRSGGYLVLALDHKHPALMHESYQQLYSEDLDGWDLPSLTMVGNTLYDFDLVCMDIVYDVITEGYHQLWPERHVMPFGVTVR